MNDQIARLRSDFLDAYAASIARVNGRDAVKRALAQETIGFRPTHVLAIGKAAAAMMYGAVDALGDDLRQGLVVTKHGHLEGIQNNPRIAALEAAHPVADQSSLRAGDAVLRFVAEAGADARFLLLFSGGASALVEVLAPGFGAEDLSRVNQWLLASGLSIGPMNRIRKRLSQIKGGRLAGTIAGRQAHVMLISDVPGDDPKVVGSGLAVFHRADDLDVSDLPLPDWLREMTDQGPELVAEQAFTSISLEFVAKPEHARRAAGEFLQAKGYRVEQHEQLLEGDAVQTGVWLVEQARSNAGLVHVFSSETTVVLPSEPGRGGRCQALALSAATVLAERTKAPAGAVEVLLAAGTDGTDGPVDDAGAVVDSGTLARGEVQAADPAQALQKADAGSYLALCEDLITTGPTGTNVMDLILVARLD